MSSSDADNLTLKDLIAVPITEFMSGSKVPVDLYVRLSEEKFVLLVKTGSQVELQRLHNYSNRDIHHFYVKKDEYKKYVNQNVGIAEIIAKKPNIKPEKKATLLTQSTTAVFAEMEGLGMNKESVEHATQVSQSLIEVVEAKPDLNSLIQSLNSISSDLVRHSVAVSVLSTMIGKKLGWTAKGTIDKLALGGLLHDIGKKELSPELLTKPRAQWSFEEVSLYESHPYRGLQLLQSVPTVPEDVYAMAYEHHENAIGQGFPRRLRDLRMNPLARVTALANTFCDLTLKSIDNDKPKSGTEAIQYIDVTLGKPYNREIFAALKRLIEDDD